MKIIYFTSFRSIWYSHVNNHPYWRVENDGSEIYQRWWCVIGECLHEIVLWDKRLWCIRLWREGKYFFHRTLLMNHKETQRSGERTEEKKKEYIFHHPDLCRDDFKFWVLPRLFDSYRNVYLGLFWFKFMRNDIIAKNHLSTYTSD